MSRLKIIKFSLILVLMGMVVALIINYYLNVLETGNMVENTKSGAGHIKDGYESTILVPQYYSINGNNQKFFIQADSASKNKELVELKKISGNMELANGLKIDFNANYGEMDTITKKIALSDDIMMQTNAGSTLQATKLFIERDSCCYNISSDTKIKLSYQNITVTAEEFSFSKDRFIKFSGSVQIKIKGS